MQRAARPTSSSTSSSNNKPPTTPIRRTRLNSKDNITTTPLRRRLNSRDIATSYQGNFGFAEDLLPFEIHRNHLTTTATGFLLGWCLIYFTALAVVQIMSVLFIGPPYSLSLTNVLHTVGTILSIHWIKGSPFDEQGERAGLTLWEQLVAEGTSARHVRCLLLLVPTLLTYAACLQCQYQPEFCIINSVSWMIAILAKLPFMNGVRIFGINRTVGIDDLPDDYDNDDDSGIVGLDGDRKALQSNMASPHQRGRASNNNNYHRD
jgi:hypothetical protein